MRTTGWTLEGARLRRNARQYIVLARMIGNEIDDVAEEGADALPGRVARAKGRRRWVHPSTLARAPDVGTTVAIRRKYRSRPPLELRRLSAGARLDGERDQ